MTDLCYASARDLAAMIAARSVSSAEVLEAHLDRVRRDNPHVNAICTLVEEPARAAARRADDLAARGEPLGPLHGLPIVIKDLVPTAGIRTTWGSRIYADVVPTEDAVSVERIKRAGAIIIGKSNTPELGAGSQTFNEVFGETRNPYDTTRTCGGSSGGSAVALACGMVPLADGTDMGGSLRNPASFCNVVGFRPSIGRVPEWPARSAWHTLSVPGPMGRSAADVAWLLAVMAGPDPRAPLSIDESGDRFRGDLRRAFRGTRVAWSATLGRYPVERVVRDVCAAAAASLGDLGCEVDAADPDVSGADEIFQTLRAASFAGAYADDLERHRDLMKDTVIWNVERGLALSARDVARAETARTALYHRVRTFLERYEFLVLPTVQVAPFPIEERWVASIDGVELRTYIDWMATCYVITLTGLPAVSVPAGFTPGGLPVGLQIVGRHHRDFDVLQLAHAFELATGHGRRRPAPFLDLP